MLWVPQVFIAVFGVGAIWLVGCTTPKVRRWGYVLGLAAQPFWFWTTVAHKQYGITALCLFYGVSWARGLYKHWRTTGT